MLSIDVSSLLRLRKFLQKKKKNSLPPQLINVCLQHVCFSWNASSAALPEVSFIFSPDKGFVCRVFPYLNWQRVLYFIQTALESNLWFVILAYTNKMWFDGMWLGNTLHSPAGQQTIRCPNVWDSPVFLDLHWPQKAPQIPRCCRNFMNNQESHQKTFMNPRCQHTRHQTNNV